MDTEVPPLRHFTDKHFPHFGRILINKFLMVDVWIHWCAEPSSSSTSVAIIGTPGYIYEQIGRPCFPQQNIQFTCISVLIYNSYSKSKRFTLISLII